MGSKFIWSGSKIDLDLQKYNFFSFHLYYTKIKDFELRTKNATKIDVEVAKRQLLKTVENDMKLLNQVSKTLIYMHSQNLMMIYYFVWKNESLQIILHVLGQ